MAPLHDGPAVVHLRWLSDDCNASTLWRHSVDIEVLWTNDLALSKRSVLHISNECFVPFGVVMGFPNNSLFSAKLTADVMRVFQSGFMDKIADEVRWEMQRSSAGKLLAVKASTFKIINAEEKGLSLEDTQGMFLLLGAGFLLATTALLSEWMGGFTKRCRQIRRNRKIPSSTNSRDNLITTPKSNIDNEVKIINDEIDSRIDYNSRSSSAESRDSLEGKIINVTEENIMVHSDLDANWGSRRSSSIDLDREVKEIFERDQIIKRIKTDEVVGVQDETRENTASKGAFGDHLK